MSSEEILEKIARTIFETFGVDGIEITRETVADDIPGWDSLSHTILMLSLEQTFSLEMANTIDYKNVGNLVDALAAQLNE